MIKTIMAAGFAAAIATAGLPAAAQLKFATVSPPQGPLNARVLHPWADKVNASGEASVQLDVRDGYALGNFANIYDRVMNDVVQVASGLQGAVAAQGGAPKAEGLEAVLAAAANQLKP